MKAMSNTRSDHDRAENARQVKRKAVEFLNEIGGKMPRKQIRTFAEQLEIPYLVHFTRLENLESILAHGILPVDQFEEADTNPVINDQLRLDGHLDGISISIAFPNSQMFFKCRKDNEDSSWVILVLHPSIIWEKDCAFCRHNAADGRISCQPLNTLKTPQAFQELFSEIPGYQTRVEQCLKVYDPTDVQAEVLVFDVIEPELIGPIVFDSSAAKNRFNEIVGDRKTYAHAKDKGLFASRSYARKYQ